MVPPGGEVIRDFQATPTPDRLENNNFPSGWTVCPPTGILIQVDSDVVMMLPVGAGKVPSIWDDGIIDDPAEGGLSKTGKKG